MTSFEEEWADKWAPICEDFLRFKYPKNPKARSYPQLFWDWLCSRGLRPVELTSQDFVEYSLALESGELCRMKSRYRPSTLALLRSVALAWTRYLTKEGFLLQDPFEGFSPRHPPKSLKEKTLTRSQVKRLLGLPDLGEPIGLRDRAVLELAYGSGLRAGELARLKLDSVLLEERSLLLRKTKNSLDRFVPLTESSYRILKLYLREARPLLTSPRTGEALWLSYHRTPLLVVGVKEIPARYLPRCDFHFSMHDLRHACATHLLEGGASVVKIAALLGHESLESTKLYTKVRVRELQKAHALAHPRP